MGACSWRSRRPGSIAGRSARRPRPSARTCGSFLRPRRRRRPDFGPACAAGRRPRPTSRFWRGSSNTVSRALRLIEAGALDDGDVEALADAAGHRASGSCGGCSAQHLGASPISIAQTRRILLAKQLIQDTRLPMTEVASAAGFGSVRRFNEMFQQLYRAAAGRRCGARAWSTSRCHDRGGHGQAGLPAAVRLGCASWRSCGLRAIPGHRGGARATGMRGRSRSVTTRGVLVVEPAERELPARRPFGFQICGPCRRSSPGCAACSTWPPIRWRSARISARTRCWRRWSPPGRGCGCRARGTGSSSRCAPSLGSRSRVAAATRLAGKLVAAYGETLGDPAGWRRGLTHVFPHPRQLAGGGSGRDRHAEAQADGAGVAGGGGRRRSADLRAARRSLEQAVAQLRSLPGIGEWTAQYIAMRELREPDAFPGGRYRPDARDGRRAPACGRRPPSCWRMPSNGGPGGPMPRCICGRRSRTRRRRWRRESGA